MGGRRFSAVGLSRRSGSRWSSGGPAAWLPTDLANLTLWLRSDMGITTDTGGVAAWADQSPESNDAVQATSGQRPDFTASDANFNGHPSVNFVRSSVDLLTIAHDATLNVLSTGYTVYFVLNQAASAGSHILASKGAKEWLLKSENTAKSQGFLRNAADTGAATVLNGPALDDGSTHVFRMRWGADDTTLGLRLDSGSEATGTATGHLVTTDDLYISDGIAAGQNVEADIAEILIVQREVTADEDTAILAYANARYGL